MTKIALITDSTANLTAQQERDWQVNVVPLSVTFGQDTYLETDLSSEEFYTRLKTDPHFPVSSQPAPSAFAEVFDQLVQEGVKEAIVVTLSAKISGTNQCARMMAEEYADQLNVHVVDSQAAAAEMVRLVQYAAQLIEKEWPVDQILQAMQKFVERMTTVIVVNELDSLVRGGRLSSGVAMVGNMLKIKPLLEFEQGEIVLKEKIRTEQRAIKRVLALLDDYIKDAAETEQVVVGISEGHYRDKAEELAQEIKDRYADIPVLVSTFSPVVATHLGERALGVVWSVVDREI